MFSYNKLIHGKKNLIACQNCGRMHELHTICGYCYQKVRQETEAIKQKLMTDSERHVTDREKVVLYSDEVLSEKEAAEKHIVELKRPRPSWLSEELKKRWSRPIKGAEENGSKQQETAESKD
ncbi:unnamed protein product [Soboliphyme baturini]|uniref:39S ribosomal protein L32, mitochondrial n=1 Tax=Soboliphyme baturini TaxID=241478 RepID=A0A183IDJ9_9BILA|nr:unnamed protein product [Soboliphyme baturini]